MRIGSEKGKKGVGSGGWGTGMGEQFPTPHSPLPTPHSLFALLAFFTLFSFFASTAICIAARAQVTSSWQKRPPEKEFEITEGVFHDGLGTFAELSLANRLIAIARISQQPFDLSRSEAKM